jgi:hypothetical protein
VSESFEETERSIGIGERIADDEFVDEDFLDERFEPSDLLEEAL